MFLQKASTAFVLRATAFLEQGEPEEAIAELRYSIRAAESLNGEPGMISALVRRALWNQVMDVIEQGLAANQWKDTQIRELSQQLLKAKFLHELTFALDSERGVGNKMFDQLAATDRWTLAKYVGAR
jgi:hypothetical protein